MSKRDGSWLVQLQGYPTVSTDDLTLDELEVAERACGVPYTLMDPHASIRIAKALLAVLLVRAENPGTDAARQAAEDRALQRVGKLSVRNLHGAFTYVEPTAPQPATGGASADPPPSGPTSVAG